jgi:hypothetical protein
VGDDFFFVVGNPYDFFGGLSLWMDEKGKLLGGEFFAMSEPMRNNGSFRGIISVPDAAATITLLGMGLAALALFRRSAGGTA